MDIKRFKAWAESKKLSTDGETGRNYSYTFYDSKTQAAWGAWQATKAQAVPEGFVLVSREMPKSFDEGLYVYSNSISIVDECSDGFIPMSDINHAEVWKLAIEAQEPAND